MGVAIGRFLPLPAYEKIQAEVVAAFSLPQDHLELVVVDTEAGSSLPAQGGTQILDASDDLGPEGMEVHVLAGTLRMRQVSARLANKLLHVTRETRARERWRWAM